MVRPCLSLTGLTMLAFVGSVGCGAGGAPALSVSASSTRQRIYYGTSDPNDDAVVALWIDSPQGQASQSLCTGTLIAPTFVVTAAHCLEGATLVTVAFGSNGEAPFATRTASHFLANPNYDGSQQTADIGMLELSSAAPSSITPIPCLPSSLGLSPTDDGATVRFAGFGETDTGTLGVRNQVAGTIALVCAGTSSCSYQQVGVPPGTFAYSEHSGGPCAGDSGGPAFITRGSTQYVAGVTSFGDQSCASYGVSTSVSNYASFVADFMSATGGSTGVGSIGGPCSMGICTDMQGKLVCLDNGRVPAIAPTCSPTDNSGCPIDFVPMSTQDSSGNPACACLEACSDIGTGGGNTGGGTITGTCSAGACTATLAGAICLDNGKIPASAPTCNPTDASGCPTSLVPVLIEESSGNPGCVCLQECTTGGTVGGAGGSSTASSGSSSSGGSRPKRSGCAQTPTSPWVSMFCLVAFVERRGRQRATDR